MSRDGSVGSRDAFVVNGYLDSYQNKTYVVKRPGFQITGFTPLNSSCQGLFYYQGVYYYVGDNGVLGDILVSTSGTQNAGTDGKVFTQQTTNPVVPWSGRDGFGCVVFKNQIFVIGGTATVSGNSDIYSSPDGQNWTPVSAGSAFPQRALFGCVVFKEQIWVMGGFNASSGLQLNDVWSSTDGATWTQLTANAPWQARQGMCCVVGNGGIFLYGGYNGTADLNDVWFSPDGINWSELLPNGHTQWQPRVGATGLFFFGLLFLIGGSNALGYQNNAYSSPDGKNWTLTTGAAWVGGGRSNMAGVVYNGFMWLVSGQTLGGLDSDIYYCPNAQGSIWTLVTSSPGFGPRANAGAVAFPSPPNLQAISSSPYSLQQFLTIWVMGGFNFSAPYLNDVWRGNIDTPILVEYALAPITNNLAYNFASFNNGTQLLVQNPTNLWVLTGATVNKVTDTNYPQFTVPGVQVLNNIAYVMSQNKTIFGSATSDATTWPGLQYEQADYEDDPGVCLAKYSNYLVAFGSYTMQFFYDAGNPAPGLSLSVFEGANQRIGCVNAGTVQNMNNTLYFVGQDRQGDTGVYVLNGFTPQRVSVPWVDTVLQQYMFTGSGPVAGRIDSLVTEAFGHKFYILPLYGSGGYALVLDITTNQWSPWKVGIFTDWPFSFAVTNLDLGITILGGNSNTDGEIFSWNPDTYNDDGLPISLIVQTDKIDDGNSARKFYQYMDFVSDSNVNLNLPPYSGTTIQVSYSDNDYQSFSAPRNLVLNSPAAPTQRPRLARLGASYRRAWRFEQSDNNPARWEAIEITYETDDGA